MNFNSLSFLIFLPIVIATHWLVPHKYRWGVLLAASLYFYMSWNVYLIGLLALTTFASYGGGLLMPKCKSKVQKKLILVLTLVICLGVLIFFKYANYLGSGFTAIYSYLSGKSTTFSPLDLILPVGISFYTFQTLSYVIDVYKGSTEPERHLGYYALFVCFFPQLVAGPIERSGDLLPQLRREKSFDLGDFNDGMWWLLSGFIRKCVIADSAGMYVNRVYGNMEECNGIAVFIATLLFLLQIYNDFAGYSEIALGSAKLLGVNLTQNFNKPLISMSVTEFFRRWHITLNRWFTDYVYIPLGGNRKGTARKMFNTLFVFILCGLWHGANNTYLLWGLFAGTAISFETIIRKPLRRLEAKYTILTSRTVQAFKRIFMMIVFTLSSVLFRAVNVSQIGLAYRKIFTELSLGRAGLTEGLASLGIAVSDFVFIMAIVAIMAILPDKFRVKKESINALAAARFTFGVLAVALCWMNLYAITGTSEFFYFQF